MKTTSHFVGLKIKQGALADLFVKLYKLFESNDVLDSVILQNPNTPHITLCYLDEDINESYFLDRIRDCEVKVKLDRIGTFNDERVFYLSCEDYTELEDEYNWYQEIFKNDAVDTNLEFVPHVTLFRVVDRLKFAGVRSKILRLIEEYLREIDGMDMNDGIGLFAVNSEFQPELQLEVK